MRTWIVRIAAGDRDAFAALYEVFAPRLYGYLRLQVRNDRDIEDLMQDTFVTIWRSAGRYTAASSSATWIFGIARHKLLDFMRVRYRHAHVQVADPLTLSDLPDTGDSDFAASVATTLSIERALATLPALYAEMFYLVYNESMTYRELADVLGISEGTVKSRMHHARQHLRRHLREEGTGDGRAL